MSFELFWGVGARGRAVWCGCEDCPMLSLALLNGGDSMVWWVCEPAGCFRYVAGLLARSLRRGKVPYLRLALVVLRSSASSCSRRPCCRRARAG